VVLASVADVKSAEARQPNRVLTNLNPQTTVTKRNSSPESTKETVKTIAQEAPGVPGYLW
jgi:hypothetical protein